MAGACAYRWSKEDLKKGPAEGTIERTPLDSLVGQEYSSIASSFQKFWGRMPTEPAGLKPALSCQPAIQHRDVRTAHRVRFATKRRSILPLPKGEGRGEGEVAPETPMRS